MANPLESLHKAAEVEIEADKPLRLYIRSANLVYRQVKSVIRILQIVGVHLSERGRPGKCLRTISEILQVHKMA